jgi:hypothetical protein
MRTKLNRIPLCMTAMAELLGTGSGPILGQSLAPVDYAHVSVHAPAGAVASGARLIDGKQGPAPTLLSKPGAARPR